MAVLLSGCLLVVLNYTLLAPALPVIMREMDVNETTVQWLTSVYAMVEAVVIPMNAFLLGRFSVRKLFAGSFVLFSIGSLMAAVAPTFALLIVARVLQAMATGVAMPMVWTLVLLMAPRENRGQVMGFVGVVISFAPAIGPPASGALIDVLGWRSLFVIEAMISIVVIVLVGAVLLEGAALALCFCGAGTAVAVVAGIYFVETIGWQCVSTPSNTWGINSLPNEVIQHGNAVMSTLMQVGASFGTAAIVSLTAFGSLIVPAGADTAAITLAGYHVAFIGTAILLGAVAIIIILGVRDKPEDEQV